MQKHIDKREAKFKPDVFPKPRCICSMYGFTEDTHCGQIDMDGFRERIQEREDNVILHNIAATRMFDVVGFPYVAEALELVIECALHCNVVRLRVEHQGRVYDDFLVDGVIEAFGLPTHQDMYNPNMHALIAEFN